MRWCPCCECFNRPVAAVRTGFDRVGAMLAVYDENARLREENRRLLGWQAEAAKLTVQNQALRRDAECPPVADSRRPGPRRGSSPIPAACSCARCCRCRRRPGRRGGHAGDDARRGWSAGWSMSAGAARASCWSPISTRASRWWSSVPATTPSSQGDNTASPQLRFLPLNPSFAVRRPGADLGARRMLPPGLMVGQVASSHRRQGRGALLCRLVAARLSVAPALPEPPPRSAAP